MCQHGRCAYTNTLSGAFLYRVDGHAVCLKYAYVPDKQQNIIIYYYYIIYVCRIYEKPNSCERCTPHDHQRVGRLYISGYCMIYSMTYKILRYCVLFYT